MSQPLSIILCRDRTPRPEQEALLAGLAAALGQRPGLDVAVLPHLVDVVPGGPAMCLARSIAGPMVVLDWLHPRAAFWVLSANGVRGCVGTATNGRGFTVEQRPIWCFDLREHGEVEPFLAEIERIAAGVHAPDAAVADGGVQSRVVEEATRPRWYPVIDYTACVNCLECLNFCLFGVYSLDEGDAIVVEQPDLCRNGCPACSRVCPQGAIMFPQHTDPGIAGDPLAARPALVPDLVHLMGGSPSAQLAASERDRALDDLVDQVEEFDPQGGK